MNKSAYINRLKYLQNNIKSMLLESEINTVLEKQRDRLKNYKNLSLDEIKKGCEETASVLKEENFQRFLGQAKNGVISTSGDAQKANNLNKVMRVANSLYGKCQRSNMHLESRLGDQIRMTGILYILIGGALIYFYSEIIWTYFKQYIYQLWNAHSFGEVIKNLIMALLTFKVLDFMYGLFIGGIYLLVFYAKQVEEFEQYIDTSMNNINRTFTNNVLVSSPIIQNLIKKLLSIRFTA